MILSIHKKLSMLKRFEYARTKFWESRWTRHKTQIQFIISLAFSGDITDEGKVLDWLISNRATGDEAERLEEVTLSALEGMTSSKDGIAVLFCEWYLVSKKKFLPFSFSSWQLTASLDSQIHFVPLFATFWVNLIRWTMYFLAKQKRTMIFRIFLFFIFFITDFCGDLIGHWTRSRGFFGPMSCHF